MDRDAGSVDFAGLEDYLQVLGYASRLELLLQLRQPRKLDEIELTPSEARAGDNPDRTISRQAVQHHLDRLMDVGLVRMGSTEGDDGRTRHTYRTDTPRLYAVLEELRRLLEVSPPGEVEPYRTTRLEDPIEDRAADRDGPHLVMVHGIEEGRIYPLRPDTRDPPRGWVIGRDPEADVALPHDPFVSTENAEVLPDGDGFKLLDLRTARNGTFLNWEQIPVGGARPLSQGDVIRVGRTLLVFRAR